MSVLQNLCEHYGVHENEVKRAFTPEVAVTIDGSLAEQSRLATLLQFKAARDEMGLDATVAVGFAAKSSDTTVNIEDLRGVPAEPILGYDPLYFVWRATLARNLAKTLGQEAFPQGDSWLEAARWLGDNPEASSKQLEAWAEALDSRQFLMVCDMLPLSGEDRMFQKRVLRSLLQVSLNCKRLGNVCVRVILTPEMYEIYPFDFPDASKLLWPPSELFAKNYEKLGISIVRKASEFMRV